MEHETVTLRTTGETVAVYFDQFHSGASSGGVANNNTAAQPKGHHMASSALWCRNLSRTTESDVSCTGWQLEDALGNHREEYHSSGSHSHFRTCYLANQSADTGALGLISIQPVSLSRARVMTKHSLISHSPLIISPSSPNKTIRGKARNVIMRNERGENLPPDATRSF